jgi:sterol 3beta-glucosyltransferase
MKITLLAPGTRGDVQTVVALALALERRGHDVCLGVASGFADMAAHSGARVFPLAGDYEQIVQSEEGTRWLSAGNTMKFMQLMADIDRKIRPQMHRDMLAACEGADGIIGNLVIENSAASIAEKLKVPFMVGYNLPLLPTGDLPSPLLAKWKLPARFMNKLTHTLFDIGFWQSQKDIVNAWRAELGLPRTSVAPRARLARAGTPILHAYSAHVVPRPRDWSDANYITGYWLMPPEVSVRAGGAPTPELIRWLDEGPAPVYLGYWRLPTMDKPRLLRLAIEVADALKIRFVIGAKWTARDFGGIEPPKSVFFTDSVDHDWLFARCSATVHHGGAGTTAATLRAKLPMVICSVCTDQPFWGMRATELGVGCTMPFQRLTAPRLTQALRQIQDSAVRARAAKLGEAMRQEDGVGAAVRIIEERLPNAPIPSLG